MKTCAWCNSEARDDATRCAVCGKLLADEHRGGSAQVPGQRAPGAGLVYKVAAFYPTVKGCGAADTGWDASRCLDFEKFLNGWAVQGWELHSQEYRSMTASSGCGSTTGSVLICIFKRYQ